MLRLLDSHIDYLREMLSHAITKPPFGHQPLFTPQETVTLFFLGRFKSGDILTSSQENAFNGLIDIYDGRVCSFENIQAIENIASSLIKEIVIDKHL